MIGYKDMTFCTDSSCSRFQNCERALTEKVKKEAAEWWGNDQYPITMFAGRIGCYEEPEDATK